MKIYWDPLWYLIAWSIVAGIGGSVLIFGAWELLKRLVGPRRHVSSGGHR